ncbi:2-oxoacid:acceptor oxidoreductase subunit alpha [Candidatus Dojkabacteria bacterium]|uniref:2-oxoacid:acceptor oxidoreductase subunit alpha n=1 Tax=Candidatus Dojkabacteria bacterium TaxID=2099670 RepID=A0A955RIR2_9BACT|nr:2-oxoacid:acceptor oxidoreductase subunit alpha [Candidatus Dojkabacteria bacterium]
MKDKCYQQRIVIKIAGASGQGINSIGEVIARTLKNTGYKTFAYREYPSLIKGGYASYQIDFSDCNIDSSMAESDVLLCIGRAAIHKYLYTVKKNGLIIHSLKALILKPEEKEYLAKNNIEIEYIDALGMAMELGGHAIFTNIILSGVLWKYLGQELKYLEEEIKVEFADKPKYLEKDLQAVKHGYELPLKREALKPQFKLDQNWKSSMIITGNESLSLGAIAAGVRAYYAYPMTPSSSILSTMAKHYHDTGILVKQAEDEITAIQMTLGSMFVGTRALVATSGGGFDLMTESLSLAGITETPLVCVIAQRPGPATGLPTWTSSGDLNLAVYAGHGEFVRCVLAASDVTSAYELIQHALNIAEEIQIPVLVLTEKQIAESLYNIADLPEGIEIKRGLVESNFDELKPTDRFKITESGISPRWVPGQSHATYVANSDEHLEDGTLTEDAEPAKAMIDKRLRKIMALKNIMPEPTVYGSKIADYSFVGWGSVKSSVLDAMELLKDELSINYLHFDYVYPLKTTELEKFVKNSKKLVLIENNALGQLGKLIRQETGIEFKNKLLKYDGRPFFVDDIINWIEKN